MYTQSRSSVQAVAICFSSRGFVITPPLASPDWQRSGDFFVLGGVGDGVGSGLRIKSIPTVPCYIRWPRSPTRLGTVPSFVIPRTLRCCCNSAQSPCVLMKKVGPTKTPQKNQHEINQLWQLLTTPPSYTFFKNVQSLFHIVDYSQHSARPLIKELPLRWR